MTRDVLPGSRGMSREMQQAAITHYSSKGYSLPHTLEAVVGILVYYVLTGERLFSDDPYTYTCCAELVAYNNGRWPAVVGGFSAAGLSVNIDIYDRSSVGVSLCREL